jgi:SpoVK/Ycf46/Vps4 family AAA+-type ATPase
VGEGGGLLWLEAGLIKRENITVVGATNRLDAIDPAAKRPGRFDIIINFKPFTPKTLCDVLEIHVGKRMNSKLDNSKLFEDIDYNRIENFFKKNILSGAEVEEAVKRALLERGKVHRDKIMGAFRDPSDASAKEISISLKAPQFFPGKVNTDDLLVSLSTILDTHKRKGQFGFEGRTNV